MKKEEKKLDVVFVLDKSGSMSGSEDNTIQSFNDYLKKEKKNQYKTSITTILFSDHYTYLHKGEDVFNVEELTERDYRVGGCTALYDSLGEVIHYMEKKNNDNVLFIIITDGEENASKEYSKDKIKKLIKKHSSWEFIYIGADIDSYANGCEIGIRTDNIANFRKDKRGISKMFEAVGNFECAMMCEDSASKKNWKEDLENYLDENKEMI